MHAFSAAAEPSVDARSLDRYSVRHLSDATLMKESPAFAVGERSNLVQLLVRIAEIDRRKLYFPGYPAMLAYCMEEFSLKEDEALKRLHAARAGRDFPILFEALDEGRLCLTAVNLLAPHLTAENVGDLVAGAAACERIADLRGFLQRFVKPSLLSALPMEVADSVVLKRPDETETPIGPDGIGPAGAGESPGKVAPMADSVVLKRPIPPFEESEWIELRVKVRRSKLQHARELLSHAVPSGSATLILDYALSVVIARAERKKFATSSKPRAPRPRSDRDRAIPAHVRRAVRQRDGGTCTFVSEKGRRCNSRRFLEFDHIEPVARGGKSTVENLRLLCRGHNQYEAEQALGAGFMDRKREEARQARAEKKPESATAVADAPSPGHGFRDDVIAGLRGLGVNAAEARQIVERSGALQQTTLEESMKAALRCCGPRRGARSG